ncbi:MAG: hypothetical protein AAGA69_01480, partial [Pseudomonadota bacterium]
MSAIQKLQAVVITGLFTVAAGAAEASAPPVPTLKPAAPVSQHISPVDEARLRSVFEALGKRNYELADALRTRVDAPIPRALADWAYLRSSAKNVSASEIGQFLDQNYGWPDAWRMQRKAEESFTDATPTDEVFAFFQKRDPITGEGHLQLARAFLAQGNREAATAQIRKAWVDFNYSS